MSRTWTMPRKWNRRWPVRSNALRTAAAARWRAWADRQADMGMTTRGTAPKRRLEARLTAREVEMLCGSLMRCYGAVGRWNVDRARALRLFNKLVKFRRLRI